VYGNYKEKFNKIQYQKIRGEILMKDELAEKLLVRIMKWDANKLNEERFYIQLFADLKYDDYQKYSQGMRYVESLALWLNNFDDDDKEMMYTFIKDNLIYISEGQMRNLVENAYPFHIIPVLINKAKLINCSSAKNSVKKNKELYNSIVKKTLFLGLSDGSHIDIFRRANPNLSNEQISVYYDLSKERINEMFNTTSKDVFVDNTIFLLDDFSGSGISFVRKENEEWKGKIVKFINRLKEYGIPVKNIDVYILLYTATKKAINHINEQLEIYLNEQNITKIWKADMIQSITPLDCSEKITELFKKYYIKYSMSQIEDEHYKKGGTSEPYMGFNCGKLPVVFSHNTPNNTFPAIWFAPIDYFHKYRGLFPRVSRHKELI
jgi:hypothetical protein